MKRIAIVGISGSGKSTLASRLGKRLDIPVIHLDKYFWDVGWKKRYSTKEEFNKIAEGFTNEENWIIDGNYRGSLNVRLQRADTIIFLDYPKWLGLWRSFKRIFNRKQPFDKTEGVKERIDLAHVKFVLNYPVHEMRELINSYLNSKDVFIIKNDKEKDTMFDKIKKNPI